MCKFLENVFDKEASSLDLKSNVEIASSTKSSEIENKTNSFSNTNLENNMKLKTHNNDLYAFESSSKNTEEIRNVLNNFCKIPSNDLYTFESPSRNTIEIKNDFEKDPSNKIVDSNSHCTFKTIYKNLDNSSVSSVKNPVVKETEVMSCKGDSYCMKAESLYETISNSATTKSYKTDNFNGSIVKVDTKSADNTLFKAISQETEKKVSAKSNEKFSRKSFSNKGSCHLTDTTQSMKTCQEGSLEKVNLKTNQVVRDATLSSYKTGLQTLNSEKHSSLKDNRFDANYNSILNTIDENRSQSEVSGIESSLTYCTAQKRLKSVQDLKLDSFKENEATNVYDFQINSIEEVCKFLENVFDKEASSLDLKSNVEIASSTKSSEIENKTNSFSNTNLENNMKLKTHNNDLYAFESSSKNTEEIRNVLNNFCKIPSNDLYTFESPSRNTIEIKNDFEKDPSNKIVDSNSHCTFKTIYKNLDNSSVSSVKNPVVKETEVMSCKGDSYCMKAESLYETISNSATTKSYKTDNFNGSIVKVDTKSADNTLFKAISQETEKKVSAKSNEKFSRKSFSNKGSCHLTDTTQSMKTCQEGSLEKVNLKTNQVVRDATLSSYKTGLQTLNSEKHSSLKENKFDANYNSILNTINENRSQSEVSGIESISTYCTAQKSLKSGTTEHENCNLENYLEESKTDNSHLDSFISDDDFKAKTDALESILNGHEIENSSLLDCVIQAGDKYVGIKTNLNDENVDTITEKSSILNTKQDSECELKTFEINHKIPRTVKFNFQSLSKSTVESDFKKQNKMPINDLYTFESPSRITVEVLKALTPNSSVLNTNSSNGDSCSVNKKQGVKSEKIPKCDLYTFESPSRNTVEIKNNADSVSNEIIVELQAKSYDAEKNAFMSELDSLLQFVQKAADSSKDNLNKEYLSAQNTVGKTENSISTGSTQHNKLNIVETPVDLSEKRSSNGLKHKQSNHYQSCYKSKSNCEEIENTNELKQIYVAGSISSYYETCCGQLSKKLEKLELGTDKNAENLKNDHDDMSCSKVSKSLDTDNSGSNNEDLVNNARKSENVVSANLVPPNSDAEYFSAGTSLLFPTSNSSEETLHNITSLRETDSYFKSAESSEVNSALEQIKMSLKKDINEIDVFNESLQKVANNNGFAGSFNNFYDKKEKINSGNANNIDSNVNHSVSSKLKMSFNPTSNSNNIFDNIIQSKLLNTQQETDVKNNEFVVQNVQLIQNEQPDFENIHPNVLNEQLDETDDINPLSNYASLLFGDADLYANFMQKDKNNDLNCFLDTELNDVSVKPNHLKSAFIDLEKDPVQIDDFVQNNESNPQYTKFEDFDGEKLSIQKIFEKMKSSETVEPVEMFTSPFRFSNLKQKVIDQQNKILETVETLKKYQSNPFRSLYHETTDFKSNLTNKEKSFPEVVKSANKSFHDESSNSLPKKQGNLRYKDIKSELCLKANKAKKHRKMSESFIEKMETLNEIVDTNLNKFNLKEKSEENFFSTKEETDVFDKPKVKDLVVSQNEVLEKNQQNTINFVVENEKLSNSDSLVHSKTENKVFDKCSVGDSVSNIIEMEDFISQVTTESKPTKTEQSKTYKKARKNKAKKSEKVNKTKSSVNSLKVQKDLKRAQSKKEDKCMSAIDFKTEKEDKCMSAIDFKTEKESVKSECTIKLQELLDENYSKVSEKPSKLADTEKTYILRDNKLVRKPSKKSKNKTDKPEKKHKSVADSNHVIVPTKYLKKSLRKSKGNFKELCKSVVSKNSALSLTSLDSFKSAYSRMEKHVLSIDEFVNQNKEKSQYSEVAQLVCQLSVVATFIFMAQVGCPALMKRFSHGK